jgi:hypothetical protein
MGLAATTEPIFIAGMYKSGTSWLLRVLNAHPGVKGVKEIDLLRAGAGEPDRGDALLPMKERLFGYFGNNSWGAMPRDVTDDAEAAAILRIYGCDKQVMDIFDLPTEKAVDAVIEIAKLVASPARTRWLPMDRKPLLSMLALPRPAIIDLYRKIKGTTDIYAAADAFIECLSSVPPQSCVLVLKGADQIARYEYLKAWRPGAKKIVIVRDGRDAAISALHFDALIRKARRAHIGQEAGFMDLLSGWVNRIQRLLSVAEDPQLKVIRYEDLILRFREVMASLFEWLNLPVSTTELEEIERSTNFETLSGRRRGDSAEHVMRKGIIGEWISTLSNADAERAWEAAANELVAMGYTREGRYIPLSS